MKSHSAYQGKGWQPRKLSSSHDLNGRVWADFRTDSEFMRLKAVMLYIPGRELDEIAAPQRVQHLRAVDRQRLALELRNLARTYRRLGVHVHLLDPKRLPAPLRRVPPNLVFLRDLFFNTREGIVLARMASRVRAGEEKFAAAELAAQGIPIRASVDGTATFEGADALWLDSRTVLVGVGNRTNARAAAQLAKVLAGENVRVLRVKLPRGIQHLMGVAQIVDRKLAVVRTRKAPTVARKLTALGFKIIPVEETAEVVDGQGMNFVTLAPREILMAKHCPELRDRLEQNGIAIRAEVEISQLLNAAGGIACATGILSRRLRHD